MPTIPFPFFSSLAAFTVSILLGAGTLFVVPMAFADHGDAPGAERPGIRQVMDLCGPLSATGPGIRDALVTNGWLEVAPSARRTMLRDLVAAHLWSFLPEIGPQSRLKAYDRLLRTVTRAADGKAGTVLMKADGQRALLLWNGENLSCLWAGPRNDVTDLLAASIGGLPPSKGTAATTRTETLDVDGRRWSRLIAFARIPRGEGPGRLEDAARLDRAPKH